MNQFLATIWGGIATIGIVVGVIIAGILYIMGIFSKQKNERAKEQNAGDDRLIDILQKTVTELEKKVNKQTIDIESLTKEVHELKRDNAKYIEIFQGKDEATANFYKQGYEAMEISRKTHDIMTTVAESIKNTNENMSKLIDLISKGMDNADNVAMRK